MPVEQESVIPALGADAEVVVAHTGELILRSRGQFALLSDVSAKDFNSIVTAVDVGRPATEVLAVLSGQIDESTIHTVLETLRDLAKPVVPESRFDATTGDKAAPPVDSAVLIVGNARVAGALTGHLREHGFPRTRHLAASAFASHATQPFKDARDGRVLLRHNAGAHQAAGDS